MLTKHSKTNPALLWAAVGFNLAAQFFLTGLVLFPMIVENMYVKFY